MNLYEQKLDISKIKNPYLNSIRKMIEDSNKLITKNAKVNFNSSSILASTLKNIDLETANKMNKIIEDSNKLIIKNAKVNLNSSSILVSTLKKFNLESNNETYNKLGTIFKDLNIVSKPININKNYIEKIINFDENYSELVNDINISKIYEAIESPKKLINNINITINNNSDSSKNSFIKDFLTNLVINLIVPLILSTPLYSIDIPSTNDIITNLLSFTNERVNIDKEIAEYEYKVYEHYNDLNQIATLKKNTNYKILYEEDGWLLIEYEQNTRIIKGWINNKNNDLYDIVKPFSNI